MEEIESDRNGKERPLGLKDFNLLFQFTGIMYAAATSVFVVEIIWWDFLSKWWRRNWRRILLDFKWFLPQLLKPVQFRRKRVAQTT